MVVTIPASWETKCIGEVTECLDSRRIPIRESDRKSTTSEFPYCGANGVLGYIDDYIFDEELILIAEDGGNFYEWEYRPIAYKMSGKYWVNNHAHVLKARNIDQNFLFYTLQHKDITPWLVGGTRAKLNRRVLDKITINVPKDIEEQKAIANALSDIDELIASLKSEIAKTQNVKGAVCRPLVFGNTRLNGFTKKWVQRSLGDELGYEQPTKYLVNTTEHQETGNVPVLTAGKSFILGYSDDTEGVYTKTPTILFDDFTTDSKFVDFNFKVKSSACKMIKTINPKGNLRFFHTLMQYLEFRPYDHKRYWISEYSKLEILVPELTEQNAIAAIVEDFENQIKLLKSELVKYECIKQGMAHDLLTGKVRLV